MNDDEIDPIPPEDSADRVSLVVGLLVTFVAPLLNLDGSPTPWLPCPVYLVVFVYWLGPLGLLVLPSLFFLQWTLLGRRSFAATQFGAICVLCALDVWYLAHFYRDALEWQGPAHARAVLIGNVVASVLLAGSALMAWRCSLHRWVLRSSSTWPA